MTTTAGSHAPAVWERLVRVRWFVLLVLAVPAAMIAGGRGDWDDFVAAGRSMLGTNGLRVYATHRDIQTGPVALFLARVAAFTPWNGFALCVIAVAVLGVVAVWLLEGTAISRGSDPHRARSVALLGGLALIPTWASLGGYGHLDDAIVLCAAAGALALASRRRQLPVAIVIGLALAVKPWAVIFLPLTMDIGRRHGSLRERWGAFAVAIAIGAAVWVPFVLAAPTGMEAMRPTVQVAGDSVLRLFGVTDATLPDWIRFAQLLGALVVGVVAIWRHKVEGAILVAVAVRIASDAGTWSYYTAGLVLGALAWDLCARRGLVPWTAFAAIAFLPPSWLVPDDTARGGLRLAVCIGAVVVVLATPARMEAGKIS